MNTNYYYKEKSLYLKLIKTERDNFEKARIDAVNNSKNSTQFWKSINACRPRTYQQPAIDIDTWREFLWNSFPEMSVNADLGAQQMFNRKVTCLDEFITTEEIVESMSNSKNGKALGLGGINNNFYKNLPQNWILFIYHLFNKILSEEKVPKDWENITTVMFHKKKGDPRDPGTYRPIALVKSLPKNFTQILCSRIAKWDELQNLIPESQGGFRRGRGCLDNLFTLSSIIQIHLSNPGAVVYAAFIDFKGAFPSVPHDLL